MYGAVTRCGAPFQNASINDQLGNSLEELPSFLMAPTTPSQHRRQAVPLHRFRLGPVSLAATQGVTFVFLSSGYLDVSGSPGPSNCPIYSGRGN